MKQATKFKKRLFSFILTFVLAFLMTSNVVPVYANTFAITIVAANFNVPGGNITISPIGLRDAGDSITVGIIPPDGHRIVANSITVTGTPDPGITPTATGATFIMPAANIELVINADFEPIPAVPTLTLDPASVILNARTGSGASATIDVGGTATGDITLTNDTTPAWLTLTPNAGNNTIAAAIGANVPEAAVNQNWTINVNREGQVAPLALSVSLFAEAPTAPTITTTSLPNARLDASYSQTLAATGATPITWSIQSGNLPNGLTLNTSTGVISGRATRTGNFSFTVRATNNLGHNDRALSIRVTEQGGQDGTFTLTLRARSGGTVSIDYGSYGTTRTGDFESGERITISARPSRDYEFDIWTYSHGETRNETRAETTFTMPNRNVTVWADFVHYRDDRRWDRWDHWDLPPASFPQPPSAALPETPQPRPGAVQQNEPATDTANFIFNMQGVPSGHYPVSITGLPAGVTMPALVGVFNNELHLQLQGVSRAPAGTHTLALTLYDNNGVAISAPTMFTLTTTGPAHGAGFQRNELRFTVGSTVSTRNGMMIQNDAAPFIDPAYGRLMVPIRAVAEGLGANIMWIEATNTVRIISGHIQLDLIVGAPLPGNMGTPMIVDGRTFVPVRYVSEMLGATVLWDDFNSAVYIRQ